MCSVGLESRGRIGRWDLYMCIMASVQALK